MRVDHRVFAWHLTSHFKHARDLLALLVHQHLDTGHSKGIISLKWSRVQCEGVGSVTPSGAAQGSRDAYSRDTARHGATLCTADRCQWHCADGAKVCSTALVLSPHAVVTCSLEIASSVHVQSYGVT